VVRCSLVHRTLQPFHFSKVIGICIQYKLDIMLSGALVCLYSRTWLYNIARGIDNDPVTQRLVSKSICCCKKFPGRQALATKIDVCATHCSSDILFHDFLQFIQATTRTVPKIGCDCLLPSHFHIVIFKVLTVTNIKMTIALIMEVKLRSTSTRLHGAICQKALISFPYHLQ
jgi:hypothetical protein